MAALLHTETWIVITNVWLAHVTYKALPPEQKHILKTTSSVWAKRICRIKTQVRNSV